jgi:UDP-glucose 4-epimerase
MSRSLLGVPCLVLGGGGFIGRAVIRALEEEGAVVRGFGRPGLFGAPSTAQPWMTGDFQDRLALARAVEGCEIVFHLLGGSTPESSNAAMTSDLQASVSATVDLLEICLAEGVRKIIFASSGGTVYGIPKTVPITEQSPTDPISAYGVNKLCAEKYLQLYHFLHGMEHVTLRVSNPFGPYQNPWRRQGLIATTLMKMISGEPIEIWGDGSVTRDYVYIADVAKAFVKAACYNGPQQIFNVGSGVGLTVNEVVERTARALKITKPIIFYKSARPVDVPVNILDIALASQELQWQPCTDWAAAIGATIAWMRGEPVIEKLLGKGRT